MITEKEVGPNGSCVSTRNLTSWPKKKHFEKRQMLAEKQKSCAAYVHDCFLVSMGGKWVGLNNITRRKILSLNHVLVSLGVAAGDSNHHNSSSTPEERRRENMYVRVPLEYVLHIFDRRERKEKKKHLFDRFLICFYVKKTRLSFKERESKCRALIRRDAAEDLPQWMDHQHHHREGGNRVQQDNARCSAFGQMKREGAENVPALIWRGPHFPSPKREGGGPPPITFNYL